MDLLERTWDWAFVHLLSSAAPRAGYCSQVVEKNRCFRLGYEVQHGGVEQWEVGCLDRSRADRLLDDLKGLGEIRYHEVTVVRRAELVAGARTTARQRRKATRLPSTTSPVAREGLVGPIAGRAI